MSIKQQNRFRKYISAGVSVVVSFLFVFLTVYGASTVGSNISTDGTLAITGLATLTGGFVSVASSTAVGTLQVNGALNATSTVGITGVARLFGGFTSSASSSVDGAFAVTGSMDVNGSLRASSTVVATGISRLYGGFTSSASSSVDGAFSVSGNTALDGRLRVGATTSAQEVAVVGDQLQSSTGTTTIILDSGTSGKAGCIQLRGTDGAWYRIYATATGRGYVMMEAGSCQ